MSLKNIKQLEKSSTSEYKVYDVCYLVPIRDGRYYTSSSKEDENVQLSSLCDMEQGYFPDGSEMNLNMKVNEYYSHIIKNPTLLSIIQEIHEKHAHSNANLSVYFVCDLVGVGLKKYDYTQFYK